MATEFKKIAGRLAAPLRASRHLPVLNLGARKFEHEGASERKCRPNNQTEASLLYLNAPWVAWLLQ
jgi:hypothetical protein